MKFTFTLFLNLFIYFGGDKTGGVVTMRKVCGVSQDPGTVLFE